MVKALPVNMSLSSRILANPGAVQRILVVDDDKELCVLIRDYLAPFGYEVAFVHDGLTGVESVRTEQFDAVILDLMLPGIDGFEVLRRIRSQSEVPVLMLTARGEETDRIVGLELGADDYLPKTFSSRELLARLRAVTRRVARKAVPVSGHIEPDLVVGSLQICPSARTVALEGTPLKLTALEFDLLLSLARSCGRVKSREQLIEEVGERLYDSMDRSIDVHIWSLRRKLGDDPKAPRFIKTIRAIGYMLLAPESR